MKQSPVAHECRNQRRRSRGAAGGARGRQAAARRRREPATAPQRPADTNPNVSPCGSIHCPLVVAAVLSLAACQGIKIRACSWGVKSAPSLLTRRERLHRTRWQRRERVPHPSPISVRLRYRRINRPDRTTSRPARRRRPKRTTARRTHPGPPVQAATSRRTTNPVPWASAVLGTAAGSSRLAERPRNNRTAADLLDHWSHRQTHGLVEGLSLIDPADGEDAADLRRLQTAARTDDEAVVAPDLQDDDEVRVLGARRGITYGRWTGGPADTLSIDFDLSRASWQMSNDPAFSAMLERAGKAWSHRIADTWSTWERRADTLKGWLINGGNNTEVRVGATGEVSTGLVIDVKDEDITAPGRAAGGTRPREAWEPRFGSIEIGRNYLRDAGEASLFGTLTHEIGHVLGAWQGGATTERYAPYTDTEAGTWTGPNVEALHGGPAPFQDAVNTYDWVDGERDPEATEYDFAHSGVCASIMAYCHNRESLPPFLPQAIDFAFLEDLGMTVTEETERPETYGLAGWTDFAAFTLAVSRELRMTLADPQPHYDGAANRWRALDITDLLRVGCRRVRLPQHREHRHVLPSGRVHGKGLLRRRAHRRRNRSRLDAACHRRRQSGRRSRQPGRHGELHLARSLLQRNARDLCRRRSLLPLCALAERDQRNGVGLDAIRGFLRAQARGGCGNAPRSAGRSAGELRRDARRPVRPRGRDRRRHPFGRFIPLERCVRSGG